MNKDVLPVKSNGHLGTLKDKVLISVVRNSTVGDSSCYSDADKSPVDRNYFTMVPNFPITLAQTDLCDAERHSIFLAGIARKEEEEVKRTKVVTRRVSDCQDEPATKRQRT
jgi:hypothetical protein